MLHHVGDAVAQNFGNEEAAVEQNRVRAPGRWAQKRGEVPRDGRIGDVGQAELAEQAALFFLRRFAALAEWQEAFERQLQRFFAQDLGLERSADQRRAGRRAP